MSKLNDLINKFCPDGVEYKKIEEVTLKISDGMHNLPKGINDFGKYPILSAVNIHDNIIDMNTKKFVNKEIYERENKRTSIENGDVLLTIVGTIGRTAVIKNSLRALFQRSVCVIKTDTNALNSSYLKYCLDSTDVQNYMFTNAHGAAQKGLYLEQVGKIEIPIPPIEVQHEIVRILDSFTEYTALLEKELKLRKKQYAYYRDKLLAFGDDVEYKTLGEIGKVSMCKRIMKNQTNSQSGVPFFKIGTFGRIPDSYISFELFNEYKQKYSYPKKSDVLISASGTIGRTVIFDGKPAYFQDSNIVWIDNDETIISNKYLYYFYQTNPWKISEGGIIARLYNDDLAKIKIPVPPIEEQERIVKILDCFDALCNDLTSGIPAEISARQKQYKYYRDKLLQFEIKNTEVK